MKHPVYATVKFRIVLMHFNLNWCRFCINQNSVRKNQHEGWKAKELIVVNNTEFSSVLCWYIGVSINTACKL
jgi:hypothetical protein